MAGARYARVGDLVVNTEPAVRLMGLALGRLWPLAFTAGRSRPVTTAKLWVRPKPPKGDGVHIRILSARPSPEEIVGAMAAFGMEGAVRHDPGSAAGPPWAVGCALPADEWKIGSMLGWLDGPKAKADPEKVDEPPGGDTCVCYTLRALTPTAPGEYRPCPQARPLRPAS